MLNISNHIWDLLVLERGQFDWISLCCAPCNQIAFVFIELSLSLYQIGRILVQFKCKKVSIWCYHHFKGPSWLFSLLPRHLTEQLSAQQQSFLMQWKINSWNILLTVPTACCSSSGFNFASAVPVNMLFGTDYLVTWGVHRSSSKPPEVLTDLSGLPW